MSISGCADQADSAAPADPETVQVGVLYPMTGDLSDKGWDSLHGIERAVDDINAAGGIVSMGGAGIELIYVDSQGSPFIGAEETERLILDEHVVCLIGAYQSSVALPATVVAERLETPFIVVPGVADLITERGFHYTFRMMPKASDYGRAQVLFLADPAYPTGKEIKRVALIYENTGFGTAVSRAQKAEIGRQDMIVSAAVSYSAEDVTDLDDEVRYLLASHPDAVLQVAYPEDSIMIREALFRQDPDLPLIDAAGGVTSPEYIRRLGPRAEGVMTVSEYSSCSIGDDLENRFFMECGEEITGDSLYSYIAAWVLKDALERAGSPDRKLLREALADTELSSIPYITLPPGGVNFDAHGQNAAAPLYILRIEEGEYRALCPPYCGCSGVES